MSIDNVVEIEMVLADGRIIVVNKDDEPGQCSFWVSALESC